MLHTKEKPAASGVATGKRKRSLETVFNIIALIFMAVMLIWQFWPQKTVEVQKTYSLRHGETVWDIANDVKAQGDVRKVNEIMWQIQHDNGIKDEFNIQAGEKITVWMHLPEEKK